MYLVNKMRPIKFISMQMLSLKASLSPSNNSVNLQAVCAAVIMEKRLCTTGMDEDRSCTDSLRSAWTISLRDLVCDLPDLQETGDSPQ